MKNLRLLKKNEKKIEARIADREKIQNKKKKAKRKE